MRDGAYWFAWYDLAEADRPAYLDWLHNRYIPTMLARPGVLWGAHYATVFDAEQIGGGKEQRTPRDAAPGVPQGKEFVLMFGGERPYVFADPGPKEFHASLGEEDRRMLRMQQRLRSNLMIDEAVVDGPEIAASESYGGPAPAIHFGNFNAVSAEAEEDLATWYARCRLPLMETLPGCVRTSKFISIAGWAKHAILYEFTSLEARNGHFVHFEESKPEVRAWSISIVKTLIHATPRTTVAQRLWPPVR
jgi:hypothetical protein